MGRVDEAVMRVGVSVVVAFGFGRGWCLREVSRAGEIGLGKIGGGAGGDFEFGDFGEAVRGILCHFSFGGAGVGLWVRVGCHCMVVFVLRCEASSE